MKHQYSRSYASVINWLNVSSTFQRKLHREIDSLAPNLSARAPRYNIIRLYIFTEPPAKWTLGFSGLILLAYCYVKRILLSLPGFYHHYDCSVIPDLSHPCGHLLPLTCRSPFASYYLCYGPTTACTEARLENLVPIDVDLDTSRVLSERGIAGFKKGKIDEQKAGGSFAELSVLLFRDRRTPRGVYKTAFRTNIYIGKSLQTSTKRKNVIRIIK